MGVLAHGAAKRGYDAGGAAGDIALIYGFAKMVAPDDSAVREGEFATMDSAMGWVRKHAILPERLLKGERLDKEGRRELWVLIDDINRSRAESLMVQAMDWAPIIKGSNLKMELVIPGWGNMDPDSPSMQKTKKLLKIYDGDEDMPEEVIAELRRRLGAKDGETLQSAVNWFQENRMEMRSWHQASINIGNQIQKEAEAAGLPPSEEEEGWF